MKKFNRMIAMLLVLVSLFSVFSTVAFAASSVTGTNLYATVETGRKTFFVIKPKIKVENLGGTPMFVVVENDRGAIVNKFLLSSGKSMTVPLNANSVYTVYFAGNAVAGAANARGRISAVTGIKGIF